jgi:hypothetical protein
VLGLFVMVANGVAYLLIGAAVAASGPLVYAAIERGEERRRLRER